MRGMATRLPRHPPRARMGYDEPCFTPVTPCATSLPFSNCTKAGRFRQMSRRREIERFDLGPSGCPGLRSFTMAASEWRMLACDSKARRGRGEPSGSTPSCALGGRSVGSSSLDLSSLPSSSTNRPFVPVSVRGERRSVSFKLPYGGAVIEADVGAVRLPSHICCLNDYRCSITSKCEVESVPNLCVMMTLHILH